MRFCCEQCGSRYSIADEKISGKIVKIKCKKCGNLIRLEGAPKTDEVESKPLPPHKSPEPSTKKPLEKSPHASTPKKTDDPNQQDPRVWHISIKRITTGPFTLAQLKRQYQAGQINKKTFIWKKGFSGWNIIANIDEVVDFLEGKKEPIPPHAEKPKQPLPEPKKVERKPSPEKRQIPQELLTELEKTSGEQLKTPKDREISKQPAAKEKLNRIEREIAVTDKLEKTATAEKKAEEKLKKIESEIAVTDEIEYPPFAEKKPEKKAEPKEKVIEKADIAQKKSQKVDDIPDPVQQLLAAIRDTEKEPANAAKTDNIQSTDGAASLMEIADKTTSQERTKRIVDDPLADLFDEEEFEEPNGTAEDALEAPPEAPRESTRIFIMAAGISKKQRYRKAALYIGAAFLFLFSLAFVMTTFNVVDISVFMKPPKEGETQKWNAEKSGIDIGWLFGKRPLEKPTPVSDFQKSKEKGRGRAKSGNSAEGGYPVGSPENDPLAGLAESFAAGKASEEGSAAQKLAGENASKTIDPLFKGTSMESRRNLFDEKASGVELPGERRKQDLPPELDSDTIKRVVSANLPKLKGCYESELKRDPSLRGRITISLTVQGDGTIAEVELGKSNITGTTVESCLVKILKYWRFPEFKGENAVVEVPLILTPGY
ncbi:MAG: hypothetical protein Kow0090_02540 [Myxococcota bacterium]